MADPAPVASCVPRVPETHPAARRLARSFPATVAVGCGRQRRPGAAWYRSARRRRRCSRASGPSRYRCSTTPRPDQARPDRRVDPAGRARCVRDRPRGCLCRAWRRTSAPRRPGQWRRPSALGSWSSYSTAHIVRDSSACFRTTWSSVSHPWGASRFLDSTTRRSGQPRSCRPTLPWCTTPLRADRVSK